MWRILLSCTFIAGIYTGALFFRDFFDYISFSDPKEVSIVEWRMKPIKKEGFSLFPFLTSASSEDVFSLEASFELEGQSYIYEFMETFPNEFVAEEMMESLKDRPWTVWTKQGAGSKITLQRIFPVKRAIHFLLSGFVLLYFIWLRKIVSSTVSYDT